MEAVREKKKLAFLHKLCTLSECHLAFAVLKIRLGDFIDGCTVQKGFIQFTMIILIKYDLKDTLDQHLEGNTFPSKTVWRSKGETV